MSRILLGVSAGISIYKSADLASKLTGRGDEVRTIMTPHALKFMTPLTFQALTLQPVHVDGFEDDPSYRPEHISLSEWPDLVIVAPATADLIARVAGGFGDNLLVLTILACEKPVIFAPAMNDRMWANSIVQGNLRKLREAGYEVLDPAAGRLACGSVGPGRMLEVEDLLAAVDRALKADPGRGAARGAGRPPRPA